MGMEEQLEEKYKLKLAEREEYWQKIYDAEVEKRRFYEDKYQIQEVDIEVHRELEHYKKMSRKNGIGWNTLRLFGTAYAMNMSEFIKEKLRTKKESKRLLKLDKEYWKPVFEAEYYGQSNPDVAQKCKNDPDLLLKHFIVRGMFEGRRGNRDFDVYMYIELNPDVVQEIKNDIRECYLHYLDKGRRDGRRAKQW